MSHDAEYAAQFPDDESVEWRSPRGRILSPAAVESFYDWNVSAFVRFKERDVRRYDEVAGERPRLLQMTRYDPGNAAYRYHSAFNSVPGGTSAFVRFEHDSEYCDLRQYDGLLQRNGVRRLAETADVVMVHMDYSTISEPHFLGRWPDRDRQLLVRFYHGSQPTIESVPSVLVENAMDEAERAVQFGARLYHQRFSSAMHWLPIPVPCRDYAELRRRHWVPREQRANGLWRVCHSPTVSSIKGTVPLEIAVADLRLDGVPIELVKISGKEHGEALRIKATCDFCFDSFWLGIQGSGLEAACMGQPVVAGDEDVRKEYERAIGECPYTFAPGFEELRDALRRLVTDEGFRQAEASRVAEYARNYHDYPVVGARFWRIVETEREVRGLSAHAET